MTTALQIRSKDLPEDQIYLQISVIITRTYETAGAYLHPDLLHITSQGMVQDLKRRFNTLTLQEVEIAFYKGVRAMYGDFKNLSVSTFNRWLQTYIDNGDHYQFVRESNKGQKQLTMTTEPTTEEVQAILRRGTIRAYNLYIKTGKVMDYGGPVYHYCQSRGFLDFITEQDIKQMTIKADQQIRNQWELKTQDPDRDIKNQAKRILQSGDWAEEVAFEVRTMALKMLFDKWIAADPKFNQKKTRKR